MIIENSGALVFACSASKSIPSFFCKVEEPLQNVVGHGKSIHELTIRWEFRFNLLSVLINIFDHESVDESLCHDIAIIFREFRRVERHEFVGDIPPPP